MKRWMIEKVQDDGNAIEISGYSENKKTPRKQFRIVLMRNLAERGSEIYRGFVALADGVTAATAKRIMDHLCATQQFRSGVSVVA